MAIIIKGQATPLDQLRNVAGCPPGILALATRCLQTDPVQRLAFPAIVDELQRIKGSVRASRPSTPLRRADAMSQTGAAAAPTFISATYCASTDTSVTYCAPTYTSATCLATTSLTYSAPWASTYCSATLPESWNSRSELGIGGLAPVVMPRLGEDLVGSMLQEADIANFFSEFEAELDA
jgi:hypothetical protein